MVSRTYVAYYNHNLIGFFTLITDIMRVKDLNDGDEWEDYPYKIYPAIKLARLAVDCKYEKNGVGTSLLYAALGIALNVSEKVGCRYMTVDSKKEAIGFYKKKGFTMVEKTKNKDYPKFYLNLPVIADDLKPKESLDRFEK